MNETDRMLEDMLKALESPKQSPQKTIEKLAKTLQNKTKEKSGDEIGSLLVDLRKQTKVILDDFVFIDCSRKRDLGSFYICKHPVTQKEFEEVMGINPSYFQLTNTKLSKKKITKLKKEGGTENHPVETVSWYDAIYYCNKRSILDGLEPVYSIDGEFDVKEWKCKPCSDGLLMMFCCYTLENTKANGYRLLHNNEWLYAARGRKKFNYSGSDNIDEVAWYGEKSEGVTHPVMQKKPNGYGLYDMSGNVAEWIWDATTFDTNARRCGYDRYANGGSFCSDERHCLIRISYSHDYYNHFDKSERRGFRIACSAFDK